MRLRILLPPLFLSPGIYCNKATFITRGKGVALFHTYLGLTPIMSENKIIKV